MYLGHIFEIPETKAPKPVQKVSPDYHQIICMLRKYEFAEVFWSFQIYGVQIVRMSRDFRVMHLVVGVPPHTHCDSIWSLRQSTRATTDDERQVRSQFYGTVFVFTFGKLCISAKFD